MISWLDSLLSFNYEMLVMVAEVVLRNDWVLAALIFAVLFQAYLLFRDGYAETFGG